MIQMVAVFVLFAGALLYLGRLLYKAFRPAKTGCAGGCGCSESKAEVRTSR